MLYLKCTKAVQAQLGLRKDDFGPPGLTDTELGNWYINLFDLENRKTFIFMSERTLLSFVLLEGKKFDREKVARGFLGGLHQLLGIEGLEPETIERVVGQYAKGAFAATDSPSLVGHMNNMVEKYRCFVASEGGLMRSDIGAIIQRINRMPQRKLGWRTAIETVKALFGAAAN
ncbi:MAG: hypothetical protein ABIF71_04380 [Planctomycetota bacterium]